MQLEEISSGMLVFWETIDDFYKLTYVLNELREKNLETPLWEKGHSEWELSMLKTVGQQEGKWLLEECRKIILTLFGMQTPMQLVYPTLTFHAPKDFKFLEKLWKNYRVYREEQMRTPT